MKILFAADGSKYTQRAAKYLVKHVGEFGAAPEIELMHVQRPLPSHATSALRRDVVLRYYNDSSEKALAAARRMLGRAGIAYKTKKMLGEPGEVIAARARKGHFSLVLMGSHGHVAFANVVLGSVVTKVLAGCKVPVLIVR